MPELHILPTPEDVARAVSAYVASLAENQVRLHSRFTIALSGGSTPRRLYQLLAAPPYAVAMAWAGWHVFWGDERCVPPDHPDSNYRMAKEALLDWVPIPTSQIYRIRGEVAPQTAAQEYEQTLYQVFQTSRPVFDLVLLGMGEDGHTASLFPGSDALHEESQLVVATWVRHLQAHRITFTLPLINAARAVAFLVAGESKADILKQVLSCPPDGPFVPAALVRPISGVVHWFVARDAARLLGE